MTTRKKEQGRWNMGWDVILPLVAMGSFLLLWWVILPKAGVPT
jgi:hypothetical protein